MTDSFESVPTAVESDGPATRWEELRNDEAVAVVDRVPMDALSPELRAAIPAGTADERVSEGWLLLGTAGLFPWEQRDPFRLSTDGVEPVYDIESSLGSGDSEAIALADAVDATLVTDDVNARQVGESLTDIDTTGTLGLVTAAVECELLERDAATDFFRRLDEHGSVPIAAQHPSGDDLSLESLINALPQTTTERVLGGACQVDVGADGERGLVDRLAEEPPDSTGPDRPPSPGRD